MSEHQIMSYDISSYDIELKYNKKIAPIYTKIKQEKKKHEDKVKRAHKSFIKRESKSKESLNELSEKAMLHQQRIETASKNKLEKYKKQDQTIKEDFDQYKKAQHEAYQQEVQSIDQRIDELKQQEKEQIKEIQQKYKENVETYTEKLETYNDNYELNRKQYERDVEEFKELLQEKIDEVKAFRTQTKDKLNRVLEILKEESNSEILDKEERLQPISRSLNEKTTRIRRNANNNMKLVDEIIRSLNDEYKEKYNTMIHSILQQIEIVETNLASDLEKIEIDKNISLTSFEQELEEIDTASRRQARKVKKAIKMKQDLVIKRSDINKEYKQEISEEKIKVLEKQLELLRNMKANEIRNNKKLEVFLKEDQSELKETGDYFSRLNLNLHDVIFDIETKNNTYRYDHASLRNEFVQNILALFDEFQQTLLQVGKTELNQLAEIHQEMDEIYQYLDTVEPLKEIEVNRLRENIEVSEIQERYNMKYAKQQHEKSILQSEMEKRIAMEELKMKTELSKNNKQITDIKNKEILDKKSVDAKLKYDKAKQVHKLRTNSTKLERRILKSQYQMKQTITELEKQILHFETERNTLLHTQELRNEVSKIKLEADYKIEVIQTNLKDEVMKLNEDIAQLEYDKEHHHKELNINEKKEQSSVQKSITSIKEESKEQEAKIEIALDREIKEPQKNIKQFETIIENRINKLTENNAIFATYFDDTMNQYQDGRLNVKQLKEIIDHDTSLEEHAEQYIITVYEILEHALSFMNDLEQRAFLNRIASTADDSLSRRQKKKLQKLKDEFNKQQQVLSDDQSTKIEQIRSLIMNLKQDIKVASIDEIDVLYEKAVRRYQNIFDQLLELSNTVKDRVQSIYRPLTKQDQEIISHAKEQATKAKQKLQQDLQKRLAPHQEKLQTIHDKFQVKKEEYDKKIDASINELKADVKQKKAAATKEINEIKTDRDELLDSKQKQIQLVEEQEQQTITNDLEAYDNEMKQLTAQYEKRMHELDEKDNEAKTIFDYEERIYTIAIETAESRYKDSCLKTKTIHIKIVDDNDLALQKIKQKHEIFKEDSIELLKEKTNEFEQKIFTTRPRLEESIGDAQKAIDEQTKTKENRMNELTHQYHTLNESIVNNIHTSFDNGYDRLLQSLNYYYKKYGLIHEEYMNDIQTTNETLQEDTISLQQAIFHLGDQKHEAIKKQLLDLNQDRE